MLMIQVNKNILRIKKRGNIGMVGDGTPTHLREMYVPSEMS